MATNIIITRATVQVAEANTNLPQIGSQTWVAAGVALACAALMFKPFFKDWSGFWSCIVYWLKPDWISWFQGEGVEDWWGELKLGAWIGLSALVGVLVYLELPKWLPGLFGS